MVVYVDLATNPQARVIVAVLWVMTTLAGVFLSLRLYSKISRRRRLWWDDYLIIVAWVMLLVSCSTSTANSRLGFGLHFDELPVENLTRLGIHSTISGFASVIAVACSKTSFGLTLLRLTDGWIKWYIIGLLVLLNVTHYSSSVFFWVSCNPPAKTWDMTIPGECWPISVTVNTSMFFGSCSALCDFSLALLPWRFLLKYNMYNREKIGVAIAMSMGVFAGISSVVKMTTIPGVLNAGDFSYNALPLVVWGFSESALTIMAASIPMMRHLFISFRRDNNIPTTATTTTTTMTIGTARRATLGTSRLAATDSGHDGDIDVYTKSGTTERRNWSQQQASQLKPPSVDKS
ncbi:putative integral membrane protein [Chaetomium fimeti]|jgi:hypothetical protein|uniref:Integral membrane protein n=1 Tax=Chaetomium fimeti TaxID=1854472 RepID=A0AAE0HLL0_9PEZI|nr:putative integral membrane protein [Chaetomium fimeti]